MLEADRRTDRGTFGRVKAKQLSPEHVRIIKRIKAAVCEVFGVSPSEICRSPRAPRIVEAKFVARTLSYELKGVTSTAIGKEFRCDHGSVLLAKRRMNDLCDVDPEYRAKVDQVRRLITFQPVEAMHQRIEL
jgi:chromosomal replication initiation ATPase DnaA